VRVRRCVCVCVLCCFVYLCVCVRAFVREVSRARPSALISSKVVILSVSSVIAKYNTNNILNNHSSSSGAVGPPFIYLFFLQTSVCQAISVRR